MKVCCHCREAKPLDQFKRAKNRKDGLYPECKACVKLRYEANREKNLAYAAAYRAAHKEESRTQGMAYRQTEKYREAWRARRADPEWRAANNAWTRENRAAKRQTKPARESKNLRVRDPDAFRAGRRKIQARWLAANPDKPLYYRHTRRARVQAAGGHFTAAEWRALKARHDYKCLCCDRQEPEIRLEPDHVVPVSKGGRNDIGNIQPLCKSCNSGKRDKTIDYRPAA